MDQIARAPKQIGNALRRQRRHLALTQKDIGAKTNLRQATISGMENGKPGTQLQSLFHVLAALNLEIVIRPRTKGTARDIEGLF